jgi:hypothetical protein
MRSLLERTDGEMYFARKADTSPRLRGHSARRLRRVENALHRLVCNGQIGLRAAQHAIAINWYAAYLKYG